MCKEKVPGSSPGRGAKNPRRPLRAFLVLAMLPRVARYLRILRQDEKGTVMYRLASRYPEHGPSARVSDWRARSRGRVLPAEQDIDIMPLETILDDIRKKRARASGRMCR